MALASSDYHSSVMWFLDESPYGNAPDMLDQSKAERLDSLIFSFHTAYIVELKANNVNQAFIDRAEITNGELITRTKGVSREALIEAVEKIGDLLAATEEKVFAAMPVMASLKRLIRELTDIAESLDDRRLDRAVVAMSQTFSDKYKAATA